MDNSTVAENEEITFTAAEREAWRKPHRGRLLLDLCLPWLQVFLGAALFINNPGIWTWLLAVVIIAGGQHGLSLITHEAAHRLLFPGNTRLNDRVATYLFAAPSLLPFNVYRQRHLLHHKLVSMENDTKSYYLRDLRGLRMLSEVLKSLLGIDYIVQARSALAAGNDAETFENFEANLRRDQVSIIISHLVLLGAFTAFDPLTYWIPLYYIILWLVPMVTVSLLFAKLRSIVEHQPPRQGIDIDKDSPYFLGTPAPMLRSVHARWYERLVFSKIFFHYHGEHHLWPWVSYQHLPTVNGRIWEGREQGTLRRINGYLVACDSNYLSVLKHKMLGG